ncbi:MAG: PKD domain-containing protein [Thermoplasmata archaeon]
MRRRAVLCLAIALLIPVTSLPADEQGIQTKAAPAVFINATVSAGLVGVLGDSYAWGDYDNDGDEDLLVKGWRLFRNNGPPDYDFTEVTSQAGISGSYGYAVWGDYNNDGYLDFYCVGHNESYRDTLWRNAGPPDYRFVNVSAEAGGMDDGMRPSLACCWLDYDRDGYLDIYVMNWRDANNVWYEDVLWHNNRDGTFSQVTRAAGIQDFNPAYAGMGVCAADYNNDGWPDIYAGNYLLAPNYLWHNNHDGTFTDLGAWANASGDPDYYIDGSGPYYGHTAGSCWGDYDNDGDLDLWVGNLAHKDMGTTQRALICDDPMLLRNLGFPYRFEDFRERAGIPTIPNGAVQDGQWRDDDTFGGAWCDFDLDGWLDLYVPEVKGYHSWAFSHLWHNNGDGTFTDVGAEAGIRVWAGIGCAWADYNNDGQPDHVTEGTYPYQGPRELHLFKNLGTENSWLKVRLTGTVSNRAAIGARVIVSNGILTQTREVEGGTGGHAHQNSLTQIFGFGSYSGTVTVEVRWPSGIIQVLKGVRLNTTVNITESTGGPRITSLSASTLSPAPGEEVTLTCTASGGASTYMWDFEGDGVFDIVTGSGAPVKHIYERGVRHYPTLRVMDAQGSLGQQESLLLHAQNLVPTARAGPDIVANETEQVMFDGSLSSDTPGDLLNLSYNWSFSDGLSSGWSRSPIFLRSFNQSGTYQAILQVRDPEGAIAQDELSVRVINLPPSVEVEGPLTCAEDEPVELRGKASDTPPDLPSLRFTWDFGDGSPKMGPLISPNVTHTYTASGVYTARLTVVDGDGASSSAALNITVFNLPPSGAVDIERVETEEDAPVTFQGIGTDTPNDRSGLLYMWDFGDGNSSEWGPESSATHVYTTSGTYTATFMVKDGDGAMASAVCNVTVRNLSPSCRVLTESVVAEEDAEVELRGSGSDTPTDALSLVYRWDFDDGNVTDWSASPDATHSYTSSGFYRAKLTVRDNDGAESSARVDVEVHNIPPSASARTSKMNPLEDETVNFTATGVTDTPSDLPLLTYHWDFGDGSSAEGQSVEHSFAKKRKYKVVLTVTDDDGESATTELTVSVRNAAPVVSASAGASRVRVGEAVNFSADANDTPSDLPRLKIEWDFGDGRKAEGASVSHAYDLPGKYRVRVTVTDDDGERAEASVEVEVYEAREPVPAPSPSGPSISVVIVGGAGALIFIALAGILLTRFRRGRKKEPGATESVPVAEPVQD